jgi:hypothetical protein
MSRVLMKGITCYLIVAMCIIGMVPNVDAGFLPSQAVTGTQNRADEIVKIQKALETKLVSESLEKMGYTAEEIKLRLGEMSDEQLHQVATRLDDIRVAGDGLGVLIAVLLIAVLVLLILYLTGHRVLVQ